MSGIEWIDVHERVPDDRRAILTWGTARPVCTPPYPGDTGRFLGVSKYNARKDGGSFDIEQTGAFSFFYKHVTHWAEIIGPARGKVKTPRPWPAPPENTRRKS